MAQGTELAFAKVGRHFGQRCREDKGDARDVYSDDLKFSSALQLGGTYGFSVYSK